MTDPTMPVFVIKAQDKLAVRAVEAYRQLCLQLGLDEQAGQVELALDEIKEWRQANPTRVKLPDHRHVRRSQPNEDDWSGLMSDEAGTMPGVDAVPAPVSGYYAAEIVARLEATRAEQERIAQERDNAVAEVEALKAERDLAVAHDRQPYPTADAYEAACRALEKHRARADTAEAEIEALKGARLLSVLFGHHEGAPKPFALQRRNGQRELVALGAEFPDGAVALRLANDGGWTTMSTGGAAQFGDANTEILWLSDELEPLAAMEAEVDALRQHILDIDAHATPYGDPPDEPGFVGTYLLTAGALHRALGKIGYSAPNCSAEVERNAMRPVVEAAKAWRAMRSGTPTTPKPESATLIAAVDVLVQLGLAAVEDTLPAGQHCASCDGHSCTDVG